MLKKLNKSNKGFTIIEVLIVLAIAALILLIVFLAVPALQRSSRNTQRKNDASAVAGATANFISNNGAAMPKDSEVNGSDTTTVNLCAVAGCATGNKESAKLGYYDAGNIHITATASDSDGVDENNLYVVTGYACNSDNTNYGGASARSAAIVYAIESGGGNITKQCVEQ